MTKNWKSATIWAVILWVLIFVEVSIEMFTPALQGKELAQNITHFIILPFLVVFCAYMYFKGKKADVKEGLLFGVYFLIIGTILDLIITIPLFIKSFTFFLEWSLWFGFLEVILFSSLTGYFLGRK